MIDRNRIRGERKKKLIEYIDGAQAEGAQLVSDGRVVDRPEGFFLGPTIFDRVKPTEGCFFLSAS